MVQPSPAGGTRAAAPGPKAPQAAQLPRHAGAAAGAGARPGGRAGPQALQLRLLVAELALERFRLLDAPVQLLLEARQRALLLMLLRLRAARGARRARFSVCVCVVVGTRPVLTTHNQFARAGQRAGDRSRNAVAPAPLPHLCVCRLPHLPSHGRLKVRHLSHQRRHLAVAAVHLAGGEAGRGRRGCGQGSAAEVRLAGS